MVGRLPLLAAALILTRLLAASAEGITLDVETAVQLAIANNLQLKSERVTLGTAARARKSNWNELSPWYLAFSAQASLQLSLAKIESIRATVLNHESGLIDYETAEKLLERDVRKTFYALFSSQECIRLAEQELATAERRYQQTLKKFQAGLSPRLDMLATRVSAENLRPALEEQRISNATCCR